MDTTVTPPWRRLELALDVDHDRCDRCGNSICNCQGSELTGRSCPDTVGLGCPHGRSLCQVCNEACVECTAAASWSPRLRPTLIDVLAVWPVDEPIPFVLDEKAEAVTW